MCCQGAMGKMQSEQGTVGLHVPPFCHLFSLTFHMEIYFDSILHLSLQTEGPKFDFRSTHARTSWDWDLKKMHCSGGNLFWRGCYEFHF